MRPLVCFYLLVSLGISLPAQTSAPDPRAAASLPHGERLRLAGVPNGGKISDALLRGAQPQAEGLVELRHLGVTTIVDLRSEDPSRVAWERQRSEALGMRFMNIPVSGWQPPSEEQVAQFLALLRDHREEKVFVHCRFGSDRTGVFVATYRMAIEGWPPAAAMNEMYYFGFNGLWHPNMKSYIRDFPALLKTAPALSEFRLAPRAPASN